MYGITRSLSNKMSKSTSEAIYDREISTFNKITIGVVERVDDKMQHLRLYVRCPGLGDTKDDLTSNLPLTNMSYPFMGQTIFRDDGGGLPDGDYCHGLILPPKVGSLALVACIDDDTKLRVCLGFIAPDFVLRTFPTGRYTVNDGELDGPFAGNEYRAAMSDLYSSIAFGNMSSENYERQTRSVDRQIAALPFDAEVNQNNFGIDGAEIVKMANGEEYTFNPGYQDDPTAPGSEQKSATIYGLTTPMGHSWFMDDASDNSKIKLRTAKGSQIILDDTNERIYINTAEGNSWFEMDFDGNVELFCYNYNVHATNNINMTADKNFNIKAKNTNIATIETFAQSSTTHSLTTTNLIISSSENNQTHTNSNIQSGTYTIHGTTYGSKFSDINLDSTNFSVLSSQMKLTGSSQILMTGGTIHLNGPAAGSNAVSVTTPQVTIVTKWTSRRPDHEPWPRMSFSDTDTDHTVYKFASNSKDIGKEDVANLMNQTRNHFWRR